MYIVDVWQGPKYVSDKRFQRNILSQLAFTYSKSTMETSEQSAKPVQS